jgi:hypothetical protein
MSATCNQAGVNQCFPDYCRHVIQTCWRFADINVDTNYYPVGFGQISWDSMSWPNGKRGALACRRLQARAPAVAVNQLFCLLLTASDSSTWAPIVVDCLTCYAYNTYLLSAPLATAQKGWVGIIQIHEFIFLLFFFDVVLARALQSYNVWHYHLHVSSNHVELGSDSYFKSHGKRNHTPFSQIRIVLWG